MRRRAAKDCWRHSKIAGPQTKLSQVNDQTGHPFVGAVSCIPICLSEQQNDGLDGHRDLQALPLASMGIGIWL